MNFGPLINYFGATLGFIDGVLIPFVFGLAFLAFLWGVYTYFIAGGASDTERETGRKFVMWAIIGFVIMLSLWGIIRVLMASLGFGNDARPTLPSFNSSSGKAGSQTALKARNQECFANSECQSGSCKSYGDVYQMDYISGTVAVKAGQQQKFCE